MRKILTALFISIFAISMFAIVSAYSYYSMITVNGFDNTEIYIDNASNTPSKEQFYNEIKFAADSLNLNVYKVSYPSVEYGEKEKIVFYAYINDEVDFYKNMPLKKGRYINKNDSDKLYMSSLETNDPNCVGNIEWFNGNIILEVRPIETNPNDLMYETYLINTKNIEKVHQFNNKLLEGEYHIFSSYSKDGSYASVGAVLGDIKSDYIIFYICIVILLILILACVIIFFYDIILSYKEIAVKKLLGFNNSRLFRQIFLGTINRYLIIWLIAIVVLIVYLYFFNSLSIIKEFISIMLFVQCLITVLLFLLLSITTIILKQVKINNMLKNKKPIRKLSYINGLSKFIFSLFVFIISLLLIQNLIVLKSENSNLNQWEFSKNYSIMRMDIKNIQDDKEHDKLYDKCGELFKITNKKGGILMHPTGSALDKDSKVNSNKPPWCEEMLSIRINNNYLNLNPIYDINNNQISLQNEDEPILTVLVPEKFQSDDSQIRASYNKELLFIKKLLNKEELELKIIYVKNNQNYFSFNPNVATNQNYNFTDPVALVFNNYSLPPDRACAAITNANYYFYITNPNDPYESLAEDIKEAKLEINIITIPSLYNYVAQSFHSIKQITFIYSALFIISITSFLTITIIFVLNYIERKKLILATGYLHGHSFLKRHGKHLVGSLITWVTLGLIMNFAYHTNFNVIVAISLFIVDIVIQTLALLLNELRKVKDILKGA